VLRVVWTFTEFDEMLAVDRVFETYKLPVIRSAYPPETPPKPTEELINDVFIIGVFAPCSIASLRVVTAFDAYTLRVRATLDCPAPTLIPIFVAPSKLSILELLMTFIVVKKTFVVVTEFTTFMFPATKSEGPPVAIKVPIPTALHVTDSAVPTPVMDAALMNTFFVVIVFEAYKFPDKNREVPDATLVPTPMNEFFPKIEFVFIVAVFIVSLDTVGVVTVLATNAFPETSREFPVAPVPTPTFNAFVTKLVVPVVPVMFASVFAKTIGALMPTVTFAFPETKSPVLEADVVDIPTSPEIELALMVPVFERVAETVLETDMEFRVYIFP
jgi:hypothetical protein